MMQHPLYAVWYSKGGMPGMQNLASSSFTQNLSAGSISARLFWKDPVLEALDQQDRSWEVVQMGFWAWKLHTFWNQWQMFLNLFSVA